MNSGFRSRLVSLVVFVMAISYLIYVYYKDRVIGEPQGAVVLSTYQNNDVCRAQYSKLLEITDGAEIRKQFKKNPNFLDIKCFDVPYIPNTSDCTGPFEIDEVEHPVQADGLCDLFILYSKYVLTDYLYQDVNNLSDVTDQTLRAKATFQIMSDTPNNAVLEKLSQELLSRDPEGLKSLKVYLKIQYVLGKDFSVDGPIFHTVTKARTLAPNDDEFQQFFAYSTVMSKLTDFPDLSFLQHSDEAYFKAWFHWQNKTDLKKVNVYLNEALKKTKNDKTFFEDTLKVVNDPHTEFGQPNVFKLLLNPLPPWDEI